MLLSVERWGGGGPSLDGSRGARRGLLIRVSNGGDRGIGEATPLEGYSAESLEDVEAGLSRAALELDSALRRGSDDHLVLEDLTPEKIEQAVASLLFLEALPSARFGLETALLDLVSRARHRSIATFVAGDDARDEVLRSVLLGSISASDLVVRARSAVERGATSLKLKVSGRDPERELALLLDLRSDLAARPGIRLDLNGALSVVEARRALEIYARAEVDLVEEPVAGRRLLELGPCAVPWFADESLRDAAVYQALLDDPACAGFVVKPTLLGFFGARRAALDAVRAGKEAIVTHTREGPVGLAAACELALSLRPGAHAAGIDFHDDLAAFPSLRVLQLSHEGTGPLALRPAHRPGLGFDEGTP